MKNVIMVPVDGSAFAEQALPMALAVARRREAALQLVVVRASLRVDSKAEHAEQDYVERLAKQIESELPGRITTHVLTDEYGPLHYPPPASTAVAEVLVRHAREHGVHLIVMATHGHGGVRRAWLGSVADSLIRIAHLPVLLIRPKDEAFGAAAAADRGIGHIVIALDGSTAAEQAVETALDIGAPFNARYTLLRVVTPLAWQVADDFTATATPSPLSRTAAADYIEGAAAALQQRGVDATGRVIDGMSPASAIVEYAETHGADLIVVTTRGAGAVQRLLLGSVADKVVRGADLPVLIRAASADGADEEPSRAFAAHEAD